MNSKTAFNILYALIASVIVLHLAIIFKIIPYNITWGGQLKSDAEMYVYETASILINLFLLLVLLMKSNQIKSVFNSKAINIILWFFVVVFALNTLGNLFAKTLIEKSFSILTLAFALLIRIVLKPLAEKK